MPSELNPSVADDLFTIWGAMSAALPMVEFTPSGDIRKANDKFLAIMGYDASEIVGRHRSVLIPNATGAQHDEMWSRVKGGEVVTEVVTRTRKDSETVALQATYTPIFDKDRKLQGIIKVATDVTQTETQLKSLRQTLTQAIDAVISIDEHNIVTFFNPAAERLWGYDSAAVVGNNVKMLVPQHLQAGHDELVNANRRTGVDKIVGTSRDLELVRADGGKTWANLSLSKVVLGDKITYTAFVKDISVQKEAQERINQTLEQAIDGVVSIDEHNNVTFFNKAAEQLWGYKRDEVIGQNVKMLVPQHLQADHDSLVNANRDGGEDKIVGTSRDLELVRRDGGVVWANLSLSKVSVGDKITYTAFVKDITVQKTAQERINQTLSQAIDAVVSIDGNNIVTFFNDAAERLWGYKRESVIGNNVKMLVPQHLQAGHDELVNANRRTGVDKIVGTSRDLKLVRADGEEVWANLALSKVTAGGEITYTAFVKNISEEKRQSVEQDGLIDAIGRSQAMISFDTDGVIQEANKLFLDVMGYQLSDIQGQHHRMFCEPAYSESQDYLSFWTRLRAGEAQPSVVKRINSKGEEVWLQACYNPIVDTEGKVVKIVKLASDITELRSKTAAFEAKMDAISRSQAVVEFDPQGNILAANENFLKTTGYADSDIVGRHHRVFCSDEYVTSKEYSEFWHNLAGGQFYAGRFEQFSKYGRRIWIQATYNPILDADGKVVRVAQFSSDITEQVELEESVRNQALQMNASIGELTESIKNVASGTQETDVLARQTEKEAAEGSRSVTQSLEAMKAIQSSAVKINEIVETIGEIAHQTNMLAFNAAIEAARAGEHGFGFSVVADEVRKLAEKSSLATKDITRLIRETVDQIGEGSEVSQKANDAFGRISRGVEETTASISNIKTATEAQLEEATKVNESIVALSAAVSGEQSDGSGSDMAIAAE